MQKEKAQKFSNKKTAQAKSSQWVHELETLQQLSLREGRCWGASFIHVSGELPAPCKTRMGTERENGVELPLSRIVETFQVSVEP